MSGSLSHRQFADYIVAHGGGSRRYADGTIGPAEGYYTSRHPGIPVAQGGSLEISEDVESVPGVVEDHWNATRADALASTPKDRQSEVYQGGWASKANEATGKSSAYLDVSDRYTDVMDAAFAAVKNKQKAIYNASTGTDIDVWDEGRTKWSAAGVADEVKRRIRNI